MGTFLRGGLYLSRMTVTKEGSKEWEKKRRGRKEELN